VKRRGRALPCVPTSRAGRIPCWGDGSGGAVVTQSAGPAEVLTTMCPSAAHPSSRRCRRLRAAEGPPLLARPDGRTCSGAPALVTPGRRPTTPLRPPGARGREGPHRAQASETSRSSVRCGRIRNKVPWPPRTLRDDAAQQPRRRARSTSSRDVGTHGSARHLRFCVLAAVRRPVAHSSVAEHGEGPPVPAPGAGPRSGAQRGAQNVVTNHQTRRYVEQRSDEI